MLLSYIFQVINGTFVFCFLYSLSFFVVDKTTADCFKYAITPSLKINNRLKFYQNMAMDHVIDKVKLR